MRGLYAIVDVTSAAARGIDPVTFAAAVAEARPSALQLRAKDASKGELLALLRAIAPLCARFEVALVANDHPDVAVQAGCAMVHVGQDDMPIAEVRKIAPGLRVGVSTHNLAQLARALDDRPDYVAYGPVFETSSKAKADPVVGLEGLAAAAQRVAGTFVPLVAIGGITLGRAPSVAAHASCGAVIAALYPDHAADLREVTARARALHAALGGAGGSL